MIKILTAVLLLVSSLSYGQNIPVHSKGTNKNKQMPTNLPPVAVAGPDKAIQLPTDTTSFSGSSSYDLDGVISSYRWTLSSGPSTPTISGSTTNRLTVGSLIQGIYQFNLKVFDNKGDSSIDSVLVIVNKAANNPPTVNAGANQVNTLPLDSASVTGTATDSDGSVAQTVWTQDSGPNTVIFRTPTSLTTIIANLIEGTYVFRLTATDDLGGTSYSTLSITVLPVVPPDNQPPIANAGIDITITAPTSTTTLNGSATDADGFITSSQWTKLSGPASGSITSPTNDTTGLTSLVQGVYSFELKVFDNNGDSATDVIIVNVLGATNTAPTANAGLSQTIKLPVNEVTLLGSGTDTDGTIVSYSWIRKSGPYTVIIDSANRASTTVRFAEAGTYILQLTVTDNGGAVGVDTMSVIVTAATVSGTGAIPFTLDQNYNSVSAAVYTADSSEMVYRLFDDSAMTVGTHTVYWNGRDDTSGYILNPASKYVVKVAANNITYTWDGTLGNNSDIQTGGQKHRGYFHCMRGIAFAGSFGYFCTGYTEAGPSFAKFNIATPKQRILMTVTQPTLTSDINYVCTDGTKVYWGAFDANSPNNSYVFGTNCSNDAYVNFTSGITYTPLYRPAITVIGYVNQADALISGMAVQQSGNFLFVSRARQNKLYVHNKTSGALLQTLSYTNVSSLAIDSCDYIWMNVNGVVSRYQVKPDGTLSNPIITLSTGIVRPAAIACFTSTIALVDDSTQQVRYFNQSTGASIATLGTSGGYKTDATVSNSKFYFRDVRNTYFGNNPELLPFLAYQSNGSLWVGDPGNLRVQHYDSNRTFVNRIETLGSNIRVWADKNNITRVWAGYVEFEIDTTVQALTGSAGWVKKYNWGANITSAYDKSGIAYPVTLSNGRTYCFIRKGNDYEVNEFMPSGVLRPCSIRTGLNFTLAPDGSIEKFTNAGVGGSSIMQRYALTGFVTNNPTWSSTPTTLFTTPPLTVDDANAFPNYNSLTSTGKYVMYDYKAAISQVGNKITVGRDGYHLQVGNVGSNKWTWKQELGTHLNYQGFFPNAGYFDIGNGVNDFAGGTAMIVDRNIITSYHGEFWKNSQTNKYNHYLDNGLSLGQFGITRPETGGYGIPAYPKMAGNVTVAIMVKQASTGDLKLYHGDESDHAGVHRWTISNLGSIRQWEYPIDYPSNFNPNYNYTDLMAGLPFDDTLTTSTANWYRDFYENTLNQYNSTSTARTSRQKYDRRTSPDLQIGFVTTAAKTNIVRRTLGTNNVTSSWAITGDLIYPNSQPNGTTTQNINSNQYLEILDGAGKILVRFQWKRSTTLPYRDSIKANTATIGVGLEAAIIDTMDNRNHFSVSATGANNFIFSFGNYAAVTTSMFDATADWNSPAELRVVSNSVAYPNVLGKNIDLMDFRLYLDAGLSIPFENFGGVGDGTTDNYIAFKAAAAYATTHPNTTITFGDPVGNQTYYVAEYRTIDNDPIDHIYWRNCTGLTLTAASGTKISMNGSFNRPLDYITPTTLARKSYTSGLCPFLFYYCNGVTMSGFELNGNVQNTTRADSGDPNRPDVTESSSIGLVFEKCDNVTVSDMYIHHFESDGIMISGDRDVNGVWVNSTNINLTGVISMNNGRNNMSIGGLNGGTFTNCNLDSAGFTTGTYGHNDPAAGVDIEPGPSHNCNDIYFYNCTFSKNFGNNFITSYPTTTANVTLRKCTINATVTTKPQGITILATNAWVDSCTFNLADRTMKFVASSDPGSTTLFSNNTVTGTDNIITSSLGTSTDSLVIRNNSFTYTPNTLTKYFIDLKTTRLWFLGNTVYISPAAVASRPTAPHVQVENAQEASGNIYSAGIVVDYTGTLVVADP